VWTLIKTKSKGFACCRTFVFDEEALKRENVLLAIVISQDQIDDSERAAHLCAAIGTNCSKKTVSVILLNRAAKRGLPLPHPKARGSDLVPVSVAPLSIGLNWP
jgi:hypothetical protein